jgi:hypothetical protein
MRFRSLTLTAALALGALFAGLGPAGAARTSTSADIVLVTPLAGGVKLGGTVAFTTTVPNTAKNPAIAIGCYENGELVWGTTGGVSDEYTLGGTSSKWTVVGGTASCTANLVDITWSHKMQQVTLLASTSFTAGA